MRKEVLFRARRRITTSRPRSTQGRALAFVTFGGTNQPHDGSRYNAERPVDGSLPIEFEQYQAGLPIRVRV